MAIDKFQHLPSSADLNGIDGDTLQLAATIASELYTAADKTALMKALGEIPEVQSKYPNLEVQFHYHEMEFLKESQINRPPFTAVITDAKKPDTMVLGWRGSATLGDAHKDLVAFSPAETDDSNKTNVQVHSGMREVIEHQFHVSCKSIGKQFGLGRDLINLVQKGLKRIIFTGHSLGGGIAQAAHWMLQNEDTELSRAVREHNVELHTFALSAPMSLSSPNKTIKVENMINIVYQDDIVPRAYGNTKFMKVGLQQLTQSIKESKKGNHVAEKVSDLIQLFFENVLKNKNDVLQSYKHAGCIIHYERADAPPKVYTNGEFNKFCEPTATLTVAREAQYHLSTVGGPGLAWKKPGWKPDFEEKYGR
eukprot:jgi/Psemu1/31349/gm1.31349_g